MGAAYSQDLRDRVIDLRQSGMTTRAVAGLLNLSESWVRRVMQRLREDGETRPRTGGGVTVVKIDLDRLRELVEQQPDATIAELHAQLGVDCCESAVGKALQRLGFTFKKRRCMRASRIGPTSLRTEGNGVMSSPGKTQSV